MDSQPDGDRRAAREDDVPDDEATALSRDDGGEPDPDDPNQGSTTSTTPGGTFVGRAAGDDLGYAEETGAERRAAENAKD